MCSDTSDWSSLAQPKHDFDNANSHSLYTCWPLVPSPEKSPMPANAASQELKCRLFSLYLRPWVLDDAHSSAKVPHLKQLIRVPEADTGQQTGKSVGIVWISKLLFRKILTNIYALKQLLLVRMTSRKTSCFCYCCVDNDCRTSDLPQALKRKASCSTCESANLQLQSSLEALHSWKCCFTACLSSQWGIA